MTQPIVKFRKLTDTAKLPVYATEGAAGADVFNDDGEIGLEPGERRLVSTGLAVEIPPGYEIQVRPRSGLAAKRGVTVLNSPGTIDADYRGEIRVLLINTTGKGVYFDDGDRIAQLVVAPVVQAKFEFVEELGETERGEGGFGSTGR